MIVKCNNIKKYFPVYRGYLKEAAGFVKALDGVSLEIYKGETYGLVGESGCGKTTLGKIILGILKPDSGVVHRGTENIQAVFQGPYNSLDRKMRVLDILIASPECTHHSNARGGKPCSDQSRASGWHIFLHGQCLGTTWQ